MAVKYAVHVCDVCGGEGHVELANSLTVPPAEWISIEPCRRWRDKKVACSWDCVAALAADALSIRVSED